MLSLKRPSTPIILGGFAVLTCAMVWPLVSPHPLSVPTSDDAYFSIWRLAWIAHQLVSDPRHLFDANVFYPATGTLAFSDAMLLLGLIAAPLFWIGLEPALIHNLMLAGAFLSSLWFAFLLTEELTGSRKAAALGAVVFGFSPFRFAHIGHLELQWVMWMPLSLLLLHRLVERPQYRTALLLGATVAAQTFCSIYYGVFLSCYLAVAWACLTVFNKNRGRVVATTAIAVLPLLVVLIIYGPQYARTRGDYGSRSATEISQYSAVLPDLLRVPPENRLRGTRDDRPAPDERSLYPGTIAILLALVALLPPVSRQARLYGALALLTIDGCLGTNGLIFPYLQQALPVLTSLRAPARFGILLTLSVSVLAATGAARLFRLWPRRSVLMASALLLACVVEYWSAPLPVRAFQTEASAAHQWLAVQPRGSVVLELPVPTPDSLWLYETTYQLNSIHHWQKLVNGYSGFVPKDYIQTIESLRGFPDEVSVQRLRQLHVKFVLINRVYYDEDTFLKLSERVSASQAFWPPRPFGSGSAQVVVAELKP